MNPSTEKGVLYAIIIVLLGACIGMGGLLFFSQKKDSAERPAEKTTVERQVKKEPQPEPQAEPQAEPQEVHMSLWGTIGDSEYVDFEMNGTTGYYSYKRKGADSGRRTLKLNSFDEATGRCLIDAYYNGNYIGQFNGIFDLIDAVDDEGNHHYGQTYDGKFVSVKNIEIEFSLYAD